MGRIKKLLVSKKIRAESDIYKDMHTLEICEDFHLHWRNLRMLFNKEEFDKFCKAVNHAWTKWQRQGKPEPEMDEDDKTLTPPIYLYSGTVPPIHGERPEDFQIEIQDSPWLPDNPDFIHIHYKSLRLDVSHDEFLELAELFAKAKEEYKEWKK